MRQFFHHIWTSLYGRTRPLPTFIIKKSFCLLLEVVVNLFNRVWFLIRNFTMGGQGPVSIQRPSYLRMVISMLKIRRPLGRLIFNMGIAIPGKTVFLIETAPRFSGNRSTNPHVKDYSVICNGWVNASCFTCQCLWFCRQNEYQCISCSNLFVNFFQGFKWWSLLIFTLKWYWFFNIK